MKKMSLIITFIGVFGCLSAQDSTEIYTLVEEMPVYPGCEELESNESRSDCTYNEIINFIVEHTDYPAEAKRNDVEGTVYVRFIVDEFGFVGNVKVLRGVNQEYGELLDQESIRVVQALPQLKPGIHRGEEIRVQYTLPIRFY